MALFGLRRRLLYNRLPLIGDWLSRWAARGLARGTEREVSTLTVALIDDKASPRTREAARLALEQFDPPQTAINLICVHWASDRHPELEKLLLARRWVAGGPIEVRLLTALKTGQGELIHEMGAGTVPALLAACDDADAEIARQARTVAAHLTDPAMIGSLCALWSETRRPLLEQFIREGQYVAPSGVPRLWTALLLGHRDLLRGIDAEGVANVFQACEDRDGALASEAKALLRELTDPAARDAVCQRFLDQNHDEARQAALAAGYLPRDPARRALFLFLTEQWDRYESLDFDRRLLATIHEAADAGLRQRITEKLRAAGRTDYLAVLAGQDFRSRAGRMSAVESEVLVRLLAGNREWDRLWPLVFELDLSGSARILRMLQQSGWVPPRDSDRSAFDQLVELAAEEIADTETLRKHLPAAVRRARVRVSGRVNDVAFSPRRPWIAVGTSNRKVILWDFQKAEREQTLSNFDHSIGRVVFAGDDSLWCAERTRGQDAGALHGWCDGQQYVLKQDAPVTALAPVGEARLLLARRDRLVFLIDAARGKVIRENRFRFWCRSACAAPDGKHAALLHQRVVLVNLSHLRATASTVAGAKRGAITCAAFVGDQTLVVGRHSGAAVVCSRNAARIHPEPVPLVQHEAPLRSMAAVAGGSVLVTASADGKVVFTSWPGRQTLGSIAVEGERLTSLHVSPGGEFLALGDTDASMSLWDLRVLSAPVLLSRPVSKAVPADLSAVNLLVGDESLPAAVRQALGFLRCVLQYRFRFDIEVSEAPTIRHGEFDIDIEG